MTAAFAFDTRRSAPCRPVSVRPVSVRPAPRREPPFDDEREHLTTIATVTPLDRTLPLHIPHPPITWRLRPAAAAMRPDPAAWGRRLLVGMIESAGGHRPLPQLAAFLAAPVHRGITADFERANASGTPHWLHRATINSVHVSTPSDTAVELCAVLQCGLRCRAVAMRVELRHGRWICTRLQLG